MPRFHPAALGVALLAACSQPSSPPGAPAGPAAAPTSAEVKALFASPTREYATAPLWVWNDNLTDEQITGTLRDLAAQKVKQVFVHPRPGLMTPYLSAEWFRLWKLALAEAEKLDMNVWIYDENSYPSGFAGGFVPDAMPESRGRGLVFKEAAEAPADALAVYSITNDGCENVTAKARAGGLPKGKYLAATVVRAKDSPWHGGKSYVDLLYPGVTEKFLEITLGAYKREVGDQFGKRVPGIFTDEPNIRPAGGLPWTDDLPQQFEKRWGYSLLDHLPALSKPIGDWKKVRHDYYRLLLELFVERWGKPYYEACEKAGIAFTGHYWEHEWPNCVGVPDNMAMSAWQQAPGIDTLMNQYKEDVHAQFGNVRAVREVASLANQLGRKRIVCEAYGAGGWDLRFEDMKRIADWLLVLGVNLIDEHLSYVTIRGARKRDHPQSFSYHEPWWGAYHVRAEYNTRLCAALTQGEQVNPILVLEPTPTAWMLQGTPELKPLGDGFQKLLLELEKAQVEYDLGCEETMALHGSASGGSLTVGRRSYRTVVVPPMTETVYGKTMDQLETLVKGGGTVLCCGDPPARVDGRPSDRGAALAKAAGWKRVEAEAVPGLLAGAAGDGFAIRRAADDKGILFHHRRRLADGELLFLVNTSITEPSTGTLVSSMKGVEHWDPYTGKIDAQAFKPTAAGVEMAFELPPCGSRLVFLSREKRNPAPSAANRVTVIQPEGGPGIDLCQSSNVLVLDFVDIEAGGEAKKGVYFYAANQFAFKKNGMERNPWDSAVQFKDQLVTKTFPPGSGFTASYRFSIAEKVPTGLQAVVERPALYAIELNGKPVAPTPEASWLDKAFGVLDLEKAAQVGENVLTLKASPFTIDHEIEPVFIRGSFQLQAAESGFTIRPGAKLELGPWGPQGYPFYGHGIYYQEVFKIEKPAGRYRLAVTDWYGSTALVWMNGKVAGFLDGAPWEMDVTPLIQPGANGAVVVVYGTLKNTLGPFHNGPGVGTAWPGMFQKGPASGPPPGEKYATVKYGLFKPFVLKQVE
jgi:hypothetical protein